MKGHSLNAARFLSDTKRADWHDETLWIVRQKRDKAARQVPEWEKLRERASCIKDNVLSNLDKYLEMFEKRAVENGVHVHWAEDALAFNKIILDVLNGHDVKMIVKSKSMLTEECGLNPFLEKHGIEVVDTDLGERIIQFRNEPPSHIVLPAIHLKKEQIGELFHDKLNTEKGATDPKYLTTAARAHLREKFLKADAAMTGVNFAVAETGAVVVITNEGNADMGVQASSLQIHCMGIEKIIPRSEDLGVFTRLLARSATGQPVSTYTSHYLKPKKGGEMHIVIVDNGRSQKLKDIDTRNSLKCIRCGACMNTCPVFRRSGGHSYGYVIPGPIGSLLAPASDDRKFRDLPFASSLCGSCNAICPVMIDIQLQLYKLRQKLYKNMLPPPKRLIMKIAGRIFSSSFLYNVSGKMARWGIRNLPRKLIYIKVNPWGRGREFPIAPEKSFREWYLKQIKDRT